MSSNYKMSCSTPHGSIWQISSIRILSATEAIHLTIFTNIIPRNCFGGCGFKKKSPAFHFRQRDPFTQSLMRILFCQAWNEPKEIFFCNIVFSFGHNFCFVFLLSRPRCIPTKCDQTGQTDHTPPAGTSCWSPPLSPSPGCTRVEGGLARYHGSHFTPQTQLLSFLILK